MRELSVYFCSKCGYYGYYQLSKNAVCPKCSAAMTRLPVSYLEFTNLNCQERDELLAKYIISSASPYIQRLILPHKINNNREIIAVLSKEVDQLEEQNEKLNETVKWMHQTIWELVRKQKGLDQPKQEASSKQET
ncbi:MAG TPA: hypothetical protein H9740_09495 [Candidatus Hungatella pullicola]|nr:hypothetical protein [Candidatus Hungatella pullicola]